MSLKGISRLVKCLQTEDTDEEEIKVLKENLASIADLRKFIVQRQIPMNFGRKVVFDENEIHFDKEVAIAAGFSDTPIHGTYLAGQIEHFTSDNLRLINDFIGENFVYAGQDMIFERPLYPEKEAYWGHGKVERFENGVDWHLDIVNKKSRPYVSGVSRLRYKRRDRPEKQANNFEMGKFVAENEREIDLDKLKLWYDFLGRPLKNAVPISYVAALIPSLLLGVASRETGKPKGTYYSSSLNFHNHPGLGIFKTIIRIPQPPKLTRRKGCEYVFDALCIQEGVPILSGKVVVYNPTEFKF